MPALPIKREYLSQIRDGRKKTTARLGRRNVRLGPLTFISGRESLTVEVTGSLHKRVSQLTLEDALSDGFDSLEGLLRALRNFYPSMKETDWVTIVCFSLSDINRSHDAGVH